MRDHLIAPGGKILAGMVLFISPISLLMWWVVQHYFEFSAATSLSFYGFDSHCEPSLDGFGIHCFGDFVTSLGVASTSNPWETGFVSYPAAGLFIFRVIAVVKSWTGSHRFALSVFQSMMIVALLIPFLWATKKMSFVNKAVGFFLIGPFALPGIIALDRGNSVGFLAAPLLWYFVAVAKRRYNQIVVITAILAMIKPHFALLAIVLVFAGQYRRFLISIPAVVASQLSFYLLWPKSIPFGMIDSWVSTIKYQSYGSAAAGYPPQVSFAKSYFSIRTYLGIPDNEGSLLFGLSLQTLVGPILLVVLVFLIWVYRTRIDPLSASILLAVFVTMTPGTVFVYYSVIGLSVGAVMLRTPEFSDGNQTLELNVFHDLWVQRALAFGVLLLLVVLPLPDRVLDGSVTLVATTINLSPFAWVIVAIVVLWRARSVDPMQVCSGQKPDSADAFGGSSLPVETRN